jgi:hypothetical protein
MPVPRRGSLVRAAWPALAAWALAGSVLLVTAAARGLDPFAARTWVRWDSRLYFDIARHGYTFHPCPTEPGDWCGNSGWFPLYPWLLRLLHVVGLPIPATGVVLAWLLTLATLVVLQLWLLDRRAGLTAGVALVYAAFVPGQIFDFSAYPLSLLALATAAHLAFLLRGRFVAAGIAGLAAALSYPLGLLLALSSAVWLLLDRSVTLRERLRRTAIVSGLTVLGGLVVVAVQRAETGSWHAYLQTQAKYEHGWRVPLTTLRTDLYDLRSASPLLALPTVKPLQSLFVALVGLCILVAVVVRRPRSLRADALILLWALATWALPQSETGLSRYRSQAALLPLAVLLPRLPRPLAIAFTVGAIALAIPMAVLFLEGRLM